MEVYSSKIKKFLIFPEIELSSLIIFLYFRKELSELEKQKKVALEKSLIFREMKIFCLTTKKILYFSKTIVFHFYHFRVTDDQFAYFL